MIRHQVINIQHNHGHINNAAPAAVALGAAPAAPPADEPRVDNSTLLSFF